MQKRIAPQSRKIITELRALSEACCYCGYSRKSVRLLCEISVGRITDYVVPRSVSLRFAQIVEATPATLLPDASPTLPLDFLLLEVENARRNSHILKCPCSAGYFWCAGRDAFPYEKTSIPGYFFSHVGFLRLRETPTLFVVRFCRSYCHQAVFVYIRHLGCLKVPVGEVVLNDT